MSLANESSLMIVIRLVDTKGFGEVSGSIERLHKHVFQFNFMAKSILV